DLDDHVAIVRDVAAGGDAVEIHRVAAAGSGALAPIIEARRPDSTARNPKPADRASKSDASAAGGRMKVVFAILGVLAAIAIAVSLAWFYLVWSLRGGGEVVTQQRSLPSFNR